MERQFKIERDEEGGPDYPWTVWEILPRHPAGYAVEQFVGTARTEAAAHKLIAEVETPAE